MPLVRVENYPEQIIFQDQPGVILHNNAAALYNPNPDMKAWRLKVAEELAVAFVRAEIAGTKRPDQVHVVFGNPNIRPSDKTLILTLEAIFKGPEPNLDDGRSERTHEMRQRLANLLAETALKQLPAGWRVWVMANTGTQERESHGYFGPRD